MKLYLCTCWASCDITTDSYLNALKFPSYRIVNQVDTLAWGGVDEQHVLVLTPGEDVVELAAKHPPVGWNPGMCYQPFDGSRAERAGNVWKPGDAPYLNGRMVYFLQPDRSMSWFKSPTLASLVPEAPASASEWCCGGACLRVVCDYHGPKAQKDR